MEEPRIIEIEAKRLIGLNLRMSMANNRTYEIWSQLMPRRKEIGSPSDRKYSIQVYDAGFDQNNFDHETEFTKWGAFEAPIAGQVPEGMAEYVLAGGLYAVFIHKGSANSFHRTMAHIYGQWIHGSDYRLDERYQFEVMDERYLGPLNENSEEEVWVPIAPSI